MVLKERENHATSAHKLSIQAKMLSVAHKRRESLPVISLVHLR